MTHNQYIDKLKEFNLDKAQLLAAIVGLPVSVHKVTHPGQPVDYEFFVIETVKNEPGFWMDIRPTQADALEICRKMGWKIEE